MLLQKILVILHVSCLIPMLQNINQQGFSLNESYVLNNEKIMFKIDTQNTGYKTFTMNDPLSTDTLGKSAEMSEDKIDYLEYLVYGEKTNFSIRDDVLFQITLWNNFRELNGDELLQFSEVNKYEEINVWLRKVNEKVSMYTSTQLFEMDGDYSRTSTQIGPFYIKQNQSIQLEGIKQFSVLSKNIHLEQTIEESDSLFLNQTQHFYITADFEKLEIQPIFETGFSFRKKGRVKNELRIYNNELKSFSIFVDKMRMPYLLTVETNISLNELIIKNVVDDMIIKLNNDFSNLQLKQGEYSICGLQRENSFFKKETCQKMSIDKDLSLVLDFERINGKLVVTHVEKTKNIKEFQLYKKNDDMLSLIQTFEVLPETTIIIFDNLEKGAYVLKQVPKYFVSDRTEKKIDFQINEETENLEMIADDNELKILVQTGEYIFEKIVFCLFLFILGSYLLYFRSIKKDSDKMSEPL